MALNFGTTNDFLLGTIGDDTPPGTPGGKSNGGGGGGGSPEPKELTEEAMVAEYEKVRRRLVSFVCVEDVHRFPVSMYRRGAASVPCFYASLLTTYLGSACHLVAHG